MGGGHSLCSRSPSQAVNLAPLGAWELASRPHSSSNPSSVPPYLAQGRQRGHWALSTDIPTAKLLGKPRFLVCEVTLENPDSSPVLQMYYTPCSSQTKTPQVYLQDTHRFLGRSSRPFLFPSFSLSHYYHPISLPQNLDILTRSNGILGPPTSLKTHCTAQLPRALGCP